MPSEYLDIFLADPSLERPVAVLGDEDTDGEDGTSLPSPRELAAEPEMERLLAAFAALRD